MNIRLIFTILSLYLFISCKHEDIYPHFNKPELNKTSSAPLGEYDVRMKDTLKILDIGNSYTEDLTTLLSLVFSSYGSGPKDMCYYALLRGGGTFKNWYDCYNNNDNSEYRCQLIAGDLQANVKTGKFKSHDGSGFRKVLEEKWDIILIHQASQYATDYDSWLSTEDSGYLNEFLELIKEKQAQTTLGFYIIHSYSSDYQMNTEHSSYERWKKNVEAVKRLYNEYPDFKVIIPYGTAIQNLRESLPDEKMDYSRDGTHLGIGLARYTATCCLFETLFSKRYGLSIIGNEVWYKCSKNTISKYPNGCIDVTEENARLAQYAAYWAIYDPYAITIVK